MAFIDVAQLITPVSDEAPCGENLEYDAAFTQMERASQGKPEQQFGDTIVPGEEPDWKEVKTLGRELLERTRDLRILSLLARVSLKTDGLPAFRDVVVGMRELVRDRWDSVHPQLDPDDDNDPTFRVNTIAALCDTSTILDSIKLWPMVRSRNVGRFTFRDYELATDPASKGSGDDDSDDDSSNRPKPPSLDKIQAAFQDCDVEELKADAEACQGALTGARELESILTDHVGAGQSTSLDPLTRLLKRMSQVFEDQLIKRGVGQEAVAAGAAAVEGVTGDGTAVPGMVLVPQRLTGEISSREDVIRALDKVCEYYQKYEPSSPVPLLLRRAKRLANKSFLDILRDLSPDALDQVLKLGGPEEEENG